MILQAEIDAWPAASRASYCYHASFWQERVKIMAIRRQKPLFSLCTHDEVVQVCNLIKKLGNNDPKQIGPLLGDIGVYLGSFAGAYQETILHGTIDLQILADDGDVY